MIYWFSRTSGRLITSLPLYVSTEPRGCFFINPPIFPATYSSQLHTHPCLKSLSLLTIQDTKSSQRYTHQSLRSLNLQPFPKTYNFAISVIMSEPFASQNATTETDVLGALGQWVKNVNFGFWTQTSSKAAITSDTIIDLKEQIGNVTGEVRALEMHFRQSTMNLEASITALSNGIAKLGELAVQQNTGGFWSWILPLLILLISAFVLIAVLAVYYRKQILSWISRGYRSFLNDLPQCKTQCQLASDSTTALQQIVSALKTMSDTQNGVGSAC